MISIVLRMSVGGNKPNAGTTLISFFLSPPLFFFLMRTKSKALEETEKQNKSPSQITNQRVENSLMRVPETSRQGFDAVQTVF